MPQRDERDLEKGLEYEEKDEGHARLSEEALRTANLQSDAPRSPSTTHTITTTTRSVSSIGPLLRVSVSESWSKYTTRLRSIWSKTISRFSPKETVEFPDVIITNVPKMPAGYPMLGAFLDSDDNFMLYRRFGYLQSRLLLEKQDDLRILEEKLGRMERLQSKDPAQAGWLQKREFSDAEYVQERKELLAKVEQKWLEYSNLLLAAQSMTGINRPSNSEIRSVNRWMWQENPVPTPEARFVLHKEDLVSLRPGKEHAWLDAGLEHLLRWCNCAPVEWLFRSKETKRKTDGQDGSVYYTRGRVERLAMMIILMMILVLLVVPIYLLNHMTKNGNNPHDNSVCVGILLVFTLAFSACISLFTRASRHEILAASAAYCAVLVVFIGNVGGRIAGVN